ncbi:MAG TPA: hypothetical protein VF600_14635 [Abditibacteriaceae bacterium]|jgi:hypothetical protein
MRCSSEEAGAEQAAQQPQVATFRRNVLISLAAVAVVSVATIAYQTSSRRAARQREVNAPFQFPHAELASLDRDVQARFAVVPTKGFGVERIAPLHHLYAPHSWVEKQTVAALQKQHLDVAFYVMSRRTWRGEFGPSGHYPVQGPVYITREILEPPPRIKPFSPAPGSRIDRRDPTRSTIIEPHNLEQANPDGTPVPLATPPDALPDGRHLGALGKRVFERAEEAELQSRPGMVAATGHGNWRVAAVPVRASHEACVKCHNGWNWTDKTEIKLGDAVGVAFYVYRSRL